MFAVSSRIVTIVFQTPEHIGGIMLYLHAERYIFTVEGGQSTMFYGHHARNTSLDCDVPDFEITVRVTGGRPRGWYSRLQRHLRELEKGGFIPDVRLDT